MDTNGSPGSRRGAGTEGAAPDPTFRVATDVEIPRDWTDANGHMNVAYYVLAFDRATDALYDALGIGWEYVARERRSTFTLAMNVDYVREVFAGSRVTIVSRLIEFDAKRIRYFHEMRDAALGWLAATNELLAMHVDLGTRRSCPFGAETCRRLAAMRAVHGAWPLPPRLGRSLGLGPAPGPDRAAPASMPPPA